MADSHVAVKGLQAGLQLALLAKGGARRAAIFVHGWRGGVAKTWDGFVQRVQGNEDYEQTDCFFFEYESVTQPVVTSAHCLIQAMEEILPEIPGRYLRVSVGGMDAELPQRAYDSLVLVGHSLGGVVIRRAVLRYLRLAEEQQSERLAELIRTSTLKLFAPAHGGVQVSGIKGLAAILGMSVLRGVSKTVDELQQNSATLTQLETQTTGDLKGMRCGSADIAWAAQEDIVVSGYHYATDPEGAVVEGTSHRDVCKPIDEYEMPLEFVAQSFGL